ncbi:hypothetical protein CGMCC3_g3371 [Colletotrichum fructicola]|uniref:Uncharacterized protein n=1 Tax=Colletotrichum fructicola (strain Nara gc5) TaxID=1213859 RepID=L2FNZ6_COLFN|nr:uncharacterized protein CGMCC3_g3371 [Colletotrichum fructicola]KAE9580458.1 hypothetical protein CGMCC3_g3371 [Colletotrichum fructicola]KAF4478852.1 hypothetical protein CGGC5_v012612 [Colletotrichum fructicola Nara gc5]
MDQIPVVNETHRTHLQERWHQNPHACARPAPDLGVPIVCRTINDVIFTRGYLVSPGADFDLFEHCCPSIRNGTNVYTTQRFCQSMACFTHQPEVAINWPNCVREAAGKKIDELKAKGRKFNYTKEVFQGKCEWIDYTSLEKELQYNKSESGQLAVSKFVILALTLTSVVGAHFVM